MSRIDRRVASWAGLAGLAFAVGCGYNPAPHYAKPPAQTPTAFKEAIPQDYREGQGWKLAQPGDDKLREKWWEIYNDPQLSALEEQVQINNQTVAAAEANFRAARALVVSARSQLFPTVTTSPSYTRSHGSQNSRGITVIGGTTTGSTTGTTTGSTTGSGGTTGTGTGTGTGSSGGTSTGGTTTTGGSTGVPTGSASGGSGTFSNYSLPFDVTYTVDFWHKIRNQVLENTYSAQASAADVATALLTTQAELAQDYFQVRALDEQRRILQETEASYRQSLNLTQILYRTGIDSEQDVTQAQTQLDTATAQATDLGVARSQYEHAIAVLMGKPPSNFALPYAEFHPAPPPVPVAVPSALLERRPDIAADERLIASANAAVGVARAAYYPNITLSASGGFQSSSFTSWFTWPSRFWSLGPSASQLLFDGGARRAATEQAEAQYDAAVANYRQLVLTAFQNVEDNLAALTILSQEVLQEQAAVRSATHYLQLALTRYRAGVDSYLNVITAQTALLTNRETQVSIELRQMTASVSLIMGLGGGWDNSKLPPAQDMLVRPPRWTPASDQPAPKPLPIAAPNPPPVPTPAPAPGTTIGTGQQ